MAELRRRRSVSQALLLELLIAQLERWHAGRARPPAPSSTGQNGTGHNGTDAPSLAGCDVLDVGGGTGGLASALAGLGYRVTVVDPSPDALASLERRTAEAGLGDRLRGVQGDASDLPAIVGPSGTDVVVCHRVLEVVESPGDALAAMAAVLRPGGALSLVVSQRHSAVLSQALAGHIAAARRTLADPDRFEHDQVVTLVTTAGFTVVASHGLGAVADHVPEAVVEAEAGAYEELWQLERDIADDPAFRALAPLVHVFACLPDDRPADLAG
ncbi:MAG: class I SAM-dependent methyltransferase [Actinomycetes bacterium]